MAKGLPRNLKKMDKNKTYCLYFLYDNDKIVYVGQTHVLSSRIKNHQKEKVFTDIYYLDNLTREEVINLEDYYIRHLQPKYNKRRSKLTNKKKNKFPKKYVDTIAMKNNPIYNYLNSNNISFQKAAELTGLTKQAIWTHTRGLGRISEKSAVKYSQGLGLSLEKLLLNNGRD